MDTRSSKCSTAIDDYIARCDEELRARDEIIRKAAEMEWPDHEIERLQEGLQTLRTSRNKAKNCRDNYYLRRWSNTGMSPDDWSLFMQGEVQRLRGLIRHLYDYTRINKQWSDMPNGKAKAEIEALIAEGERVMTDEELITKARAHGFKVVDGQDLSLIGRLIDRLEKARTENAAHVERWKSLYDWTTIETTRDPIDDYEQGYRGAWIELRKWMTELETTKGERHDDKDEAES